MDVILDRPVITEKSLKLAKTGWFTFLVTRNARKPQIAQVVEDKFKVNVISVRTAKSGDELKMQRSKRKYYTLAGSKKAIIQLKKGQKIDLFDTEAEKSVEVETKEKKSLLKGTKVKIERTSKEDKKVKTETKKEGK